MSGLAPVQTRAKPVVFPKLFRGPAWNVPSRGIRIWFSKDVRQPPGTMLRTLHATIRSDAWFTLETQSRSESLVYHEYGLSEDFYVGPWHVEPLINRISSQGRSVRVEPKVMDVLVVLSRRQGQVVTRAELFEEVWSETIVTDDVLTRSVSELRKVFGDTRTDPSYIETIPKTGYRLIAPVASTSSEEGQRDASSAVTGLRGESSVAVSTISRRTWLILIPFIAILVLAAIWSMRHRPAANSPLYPHPVTTYPGRESAPKLSPDGRQVAFSWRGEDQNDLDLYVKYVDATPVLRLTRDSIFNANPAWSPDGTEIAFISRGSECLIQVVSAIGGAPRTVGSCGASIYGDLTWSPDGSWLAFNDRSPDDASYAIYLMSPATGKKHRLTKPPGGIWGDHDPVFSPNGLEVAFVRSVSEGMQDVWVVNASGSQERQLTFERRNVWGCAWMSNGTELVVASNRTGRPGLWSAKLAGGPMEWLDVQSPSARFPSIAGNRLAFLQVETDVNLWRIPLAQETKPRVFAASTHWDLHPAISPDGLQAAFSSNRSGSFEIWVADSSGGSLRQLTHFGGPFTSTPRWNPQGTSLVFTARPRGNADIYLMQLNSAAPRRITTSSADDLAPDWLPDGQTVVFTSNRSGTWETWRVSLIDGSEEQMTHFGSFGARPLNQTGDFLLSRPVEPGLWRLSVGSGRAREIIEGTDPRDWGSWSVAGSGLYYLLRGSSTWILRYDLQTGAVDTVRQVAGHIPAMDPALDVSPDERWMLLGQIDRREADIMVVELK